MRTDLGIFIFLTSHISPAVGACVPFAIFQPFLVDVHILATATADKALVFGFLPHALAVFLVVGAGAHVATGDMLGADDF